MRRFKHFRPLPRPLAATAALATVVGLIASAAASAATVHVVRGAGFGHGIGMSQYGAYGLAQNGYDYTRILKHYYRGTELGMASSRPVRVLLQASDPYVRFRGATRATGGRTLDPTVTYLVRRASGGRLALYDGDGRKEATFRAPLVVNRGGKPLRLMGPAINGVSSGLYRGSFELHPGTAGGVTAVNSLPIDRYVQGVVASEMPSSWHYDALRAQAIAARTYALGTRKSDSSTFDQYPDTRSQVYYGVTGETARTNTAVRQTSNEIVTYDGNVATTFFFSTSGGRTENIEFSFVGAEPKPWLKSVDDPYDDISPKHRWRFRFSNARLDALLGAPGKLRKVRVLQRGKSPRIVRARVHGSGGYTDLTGSQIRARLGLPDTWAHFSRVSTVQASGGARSAALSLRLAGEISPAPRSRELTLQRQAGPGRWEHVSRLRTSRHGYYTVAVPSRGIYRVRAGAIVGSAVRVR